MRARHEIAILALAACVGGCERMVAPEAAPTRPASSPAAMAHAPPHTSAAGTFTQTTIHTLDVRVAGRNTILEQTSGGSIDGTLEGLFEDRLEVVIHPNGTFTAHFTITCECTVGGRQGTLELVAGDRGALLGPDLAAFAGRAVINGGAGELSGLTGVLRIEGTVDVPSGLSTSTYSGWVQP